MTLFKLVGIDRKRKFDELEQLKEAEALPSSEPATKKRGHAGKIDTLSRARDKDWPGTFRDSTKAAEDDTSSYASTVVPDSVDEDEEERPEDVIASQSSQEAQKFEDDDFLQLVLKNTTLAIARGGAQKRSTTPMNDSELSQVRKTTRNATSINREHPETIFGLNPRSKGGLHFVGYSIQNSHGTRKVNQDRIASFELPGGYQGYAVLDGHGPKGDRSAELAAKLIPQKLSEYLEKGMMPERALYHAIIDTDNELTAKDQSFVDSGTTALIAIEHEDGTMSIANVGDCRALRVSDDEAEQLTVDHKLDSVKPSEVEAIAEHSQLHRNRILVRSESGRHRLNINLTRTLGNDAFGKALTASPDLFRITAKDGSRWIILGCDGIFDVLDEADFVALSQIERTARLAGGATRSGPDLMCMLILNAAIQKGGVDNLSVIAIRQT